MKYRVLLLLVLAIPFGFSSFLAYTAIGSNMDLYGVSARTLFIAMTSLSAIGGLIWGLTRGEDNKEV